MRSKKAIINTMAGLSYEFVAIICAFILPRLILQAFGSDYNGVTNSISQFLGYVTLLKAGIGGVTKAALYKPLAEKDVKSVSGVVNATNLFLQKVALIYLGTLIAFASLYPLLVKNNFDWLFTFSLVFIIGISTFAQYFWGLTYQLLLYADQRQGIIFAVQIVTTVLNTVVAALLINLGAGIHIVKLASTAVFCLNPLFINLYARRYYKIDKTVPPNKEAIKDRWDCFGLQVANFVNSNTDMLLLTIFTDVYIVSVYTVYHMVTSGIRQVLNTFVNGLGAAFGDMFAKNEIEIAKNNLLIFEQIVFCLANFFFSVCLVLIVPFVHVYTKNINDVNYTRYAFAFVSTIATLFTCYRIPYQAIVEAVGHFKQTRNGAFFEAGLNLILSVLMVQRFGLVGIAIGTLVAAIFRTFQYGLYVSKNIVKRSTGILLKRLILSAITLSFVYLFYKVVGFSEPENYLQWIVNACSVSVIAGIVVIIIEIVFYRSVLWSSISKIRGVLKKRNQE